MPGGGTLQDLPKHVLITSDALARSGTVRKTHFALICNSSVPIKMGGHVFRFANRHYKNISKDGTLGKTARGQGLPQHWSGGRAPRSRERSAIA